MAGRAGVVGTGLIGGSIGMALRRQGWHVSGVDLDPVRAARALDLGALDAVGRDPHADVTFVATPVGSVAELSRAVLEAGTGVVTDVGSVKGPIVRAVGDARFVGGHPMAGSEQEGVDGARADLFEGRLTVLTPTPQTNASALERASNFWRALGSRVCEVDPHTHDRAVGVTSHVPHAVASALAAALPDDWRKFCATGFRDTTRVAAGDPALWAAIFRDNREGVLDALDRLTGQLTAFRHALETDDVATLMDLLIRGKENRDALGT